ncbi:MAG: hypothetical protein GX345_03025 [Clostridiales bacterium]|nr:hypothetical protein [Clostridiales bacterium]
MDLRVGSVVKSLAGRDKGSFLAVTSLDENHIYVCDGKERPLGRPKKKNPRHLESTEFWLNEAQTATNRALRKSLADLCSLKSNSEQ